MKTLIFSDSHLTHKFDKELFDYISKLIKDVDQVIINGDFWDAYLTTFDQFIKSDWKKLFSLLKKKNTVYIFGNHDKKEFMDQRYELFSSIQTNHYEFKSGRKNFFLTHGHLISPAYDIFFMFRNPIYTRYLYSFLIYLTKKIIIISKIHSYIERKNNLKQLRDILKYANKNKLNNRFFIIGHSHIPLLEISKNFISLGPLQQKQKSYCLIEDGQIELITE